MSKFKSLPVNGPADELRHCETRWREKSGNPDYFVPPDVMNLMIDLVTQGAKYTPIKAFTWLRELQAIKTQSNGVGLDFSDKFAAERALDFIDKGLVERFKTRNIASLHNGKFSRYLVDPETRKQPLSDKAVELLRKAKGYI